MIALHAEAVDGDPQTIRWVVPPGVVSFVGAVRQAPGDCGAMLADGTLTRLTLEATSVLTTVADAGTWHEVGSRVGRALAEDLGGPHWHPVEGAARPPSLAVVAQEVLAGPVGDYIRSHGGWVHIVDAADDILQVELRGVCAHCPASGATLDDRLDAEVRRRYPGLVAVRAVRSGRPVGLGGRTFRIGRRRP